MSDKLSNAKCTTGCYATIMKYIPVLVLEMMYSLYFQQFFLKILVSIMVKVFFVATNGLAFNPV